MTHTKSEHLILVGPLQQGKVPVLPGLESVPQVAVDGGAVFAVRPVLWAGDEDSGTRLPGVPHIHKEAQDVTDFRFCLDAVQDWNWRTLHLFGFLGGRRDHELANFGEIHAELKSRDLFGEAVFYDTQNRAAVYFFRAGETAVTIHGLFSVFTLEPAEITIGGDCRYPANNLALSPLSGRGLSNEGFGSVTLSCTAPFMLILNVL